MKTVQTKKGIISILVAFIISCLSLSINAQVINCSPTGCGVNLIPNNKFIYDGTGVVYGSNPGNYPDAFSTFGARGVQCWSALSVTPDVFNVSTNWVNNQPLGGTSTFARIGVLNSVGAGYGEAFTTNVDVKANKKYALTYQSGSFIFPTTMGIPTIPVDLYKIKIGAQTIVQEPGFANWTSRGFCFTADANANHLDVFIQAIDCANNTDNTKYQWFSVTDFYLSEINGEAGDYKVICPGDFAEIGKENCLPTNATYSWSPGPGITNPNTLIQNVNPTTTTQYTLNISVMDPFNPSVALCTTWDTVTVVVKESPVSSITVNPIRICEGSGLPVTLTANLQSGLGASSYSYTWQPSGLTGQSVVVYPTATTTYTLTVSEFPEEPGLDFCTWQVSALVQVDRLPRIYGKRDLCIGETTTLTAATAPDPNTPWTSSNTAVATVTSTGVVTGVSEGTSTITYTNSNGCSKTAIITVKPTPKITSTITKVCDEATIQIAASPLPNTGTWSSSNTTVATINPTSGLVTGMSAGQVNILYTIANGCSATASITVNPIPTITGVLNVCVGNIRTLIGSPNNHSSAWTSSSPSTATVSIRNGTVTGVTPGESTITYSVNGCSTATNFTVNPLPTIMGTLNVCIGATTLLTGSASPASTNPWSSSNTAVATITSEGLVTGISAGTSTITYTNSNGCTKTAIITVNAFPSITGLTEVCVLEAITLQGAGSPASENSWVSSSTDIATVVNGVVTGVSSGTVTITYTNSNGCSATHIVTVNSLPILTASSANVCVGQSITITANTGSFTIDPHPWYPMNNTIADVSSYSLSYPMTATITGIAPGTTVIYFHPKSGCWADIVITVDTCSPSPSNDVSSDALKTSQAINTLFTLDEQEKSPEISGENAIYIGNNIPNPFNGTTEIPYCLPDNVKGIVSIYNTNSEKIKEYQLRPGKHNLPIEMEGIPPGMYMYSLYIDGERVTSKRMIMIK